MMELTHQLDRTILIEAPREVVFRYFTDEARWAAWWGAGSTIDARPGGRVLIRYPTAVEAVGEVIEISVPDRIVFTYGYASGAPVPPGGSRVTIRLEPATRGTRLQLVHEFSDAATRDHHVQGWRYQLSVFANVVADEVHKDAARLVDGWFTAWAERDEAARRSALSAIAAPDVRLRDRYSCVDGIDELTLHIGASQRFMPGLRLQTTGDIRHCQGMLLVDWTAIGNDNQPRGRGTNVFVLGPDGRVESVTGFWLPATTP
jgi:uncharacterized protein YndB with AHSA1/START domain